MKEKSLWHRRHHDWEAFDRIEMSVVPRYKTSGLSGDEWRYHVRVKLFFGGELVHELGFSNMDAALKLLPAQLANLTCPIADTILKRERTKCDQVGCDADAVARFRLKRLTSERGEYLDPSEHQYADHYRQFCQRHLRRGDCGREDADDNYEPLDGIGPGASSNTSESPAVFGGVIDMTGDTPKGAA